MWGRRDETSRRASDRSLSTRVAWCVLFGTGALVAARTMLATVVQIHGDGMAPTIFHGDYVVLLRHNLALEQGDVVVYDPTPPESTETSPEADEGEQTDAEGPVDPELPRTRPLPNTAVVDVAALERRWDDVRDRDGTILRGAPAPSLRVGRILAVPGDRVALYVPKAALGLSINGEPLELKAAEPLRVALLPLDADPKDGPPPTELRTVPRAYESGPKHRYTVIPASTVPAWPGLRVPGPNQGPVELRAEGYLILADHRDAGACCDSRALGFIPAEQIRGEVVLRLPGDPQKAPDLDPAARGLAWLP